jgi:hypothetical protein
MHAAVRAIRHIRFQESDPATLVGCGSALAVLFVPVRDDRVTACGPLEMPLFYDRGNNFHVCCKLLQTPEVLRWTLLGNVRFPPKSGHAHGDINVF